MARRRRRASGFPTYGGAVGSGAGGGDGTGAFESQDDLGGFGPDGKRGGGLPAINIYNTAIANAAAEQGPGGIAQTATAPGMTQGMMQGGMQQGGMMQAGMMGPRIRRR